MDRRTIDRGKSTKSNDQSQKQDLECEKNKEVALLEKVLKKEPLKARCNQLKCQRQVAHERRLGL